MRLSGLLNHENYNLTFQEWLILGNRSSSYPTKMQIMPQCAGWFIQRDLFNRHIYSLRSVRFTPRRSHRTLSQTVDNLVPTIFQTPQLSCRKAPRRIPRQCPDSPGLWKETGRRTPEMREGKAREWRKNTS